MINESLLLEKKLTTDFTFGFELEAIASGRVDFNKPNEVSDFIEGFVGSGGDFHYDSSLEVNDGCVQYAIDEDGDEYYYYDGGEEVSYDELTDIFNVEYIDDIDFQTTFEYASPVLNFNIKNIQNVINMLNEGISKNLFTTNETCGFHHHLSYEGITGEDAAWIVSQLALDTKARKLFTDFKTKMENSTEDMNFGFVTSWSDDEYLDKLNDAINEFNFNEIVGLLNTDKYSILNVHRNKTLEWRGPRDFLNIGERKIIIDFYKQLWKVVNWMTVALDKKEINGMNKDIYLRNLIIGNDDKPIENFPRFNTDNKGLSADSINELVDKIKSKKQVSILIALSKNKRALDQVIQKLFNTSGLGNTIDRLIETYTVYPQVINNIAYKYIPAKMYRLADSTAIYNTSERTLLRLLNTHYGINNSEESLADRISFLIPYMNPELFNSEADYTTIFNIIRNSNYNPNIIEYLMSVADNEDMVMVILNHYIDNILDNNIANINLSILDKLNKKNKQYFIDKLLPYTYRFPQLIKYIDNLSKETILSLIGYSIRVGNYEEVKDMLLSSNKISKSDLTKLENKFTEYFKHDMYDDFELEQ